MKSSESTETKLDEIYRHVRELAFEKGPGAQLPTIRILCDELKTTRVTLNEALRLLEREQIVYRKERAGIFVSPKLHHKNIYIFYNAQFFDEATLSPIWSLLLIHLKQEAKRRAIFKDEECLLHFVRPSRNGENAIPEEINRLLMAERISGILAIGLHFRSTQDTHKEVPCVTFGSQAEHMVQLDYDHFGYQATQTLIRQGCRRIVLWTEEQKSATIQTAEAFHGYKRALAEANIMPSLPMAKVKYSSLIERQVSLQEQGYLLAQDAFGSGSAEHIDGLVITNDMLTDGALIACDEMGIQVGQDIRIVSQANVGSPILFGRSRQITVLEYDPARIIQEMFNMLDILMGGQDITPSVQMLQAQLRTPKR